MATGNTELQYILYVCVMDQAVICRPVNETPRFDPRPVYVGFVVDILVVGQDFLRVFRIYLISNIPQKLHTHLRLYMLLLVEGQKDEAWEPYKINGFPRKEGRH